MVEVETPTASPFASSLLFDYVATYMYEGDTPNAERRAAALALDRDLLRRAARPGGAARADRSGGAGGGRRAAPAPDRGGPGQGPRRPTADPPTARRPDRGGVRAAHRGGLLGEVDARQAGQGAPRRDRQDRRRGALHRGRGRRPLPRRTRRPAPGRPAGELPRAGRRRSGLAGSPLRGDPRPLPHPPARRPLRRRSELGPEGAGARRRGGPGRAAARRHLTRVVRGRRAAAPAPGQPRPAAPGGRGDRSARAGPLPAELAERRRPRPLGRRSRPAPRGARLAPGRGAHPEDLGARRAASAPRRVQPDLAGRALHQRRAGLGRRRRPRPQRRQGRPLLPRGRQARRPAAGQREARSAGGRDPRRDPGAARAGAVLLARPARARGLGGGAPRGALGPRLVGRGHQRRLRSAARSAPARGPAQSIGRAAASPAAARRPRGP